MNRGIRLRLSGSPSLKLIFFLPNYDQEAGQMLRFYQFGRFCLDPEGGVLFPGAAPVALPPKVAETLALLAENAGQVVGKEELMRWVWPNTAGIGLKWG